MMKRVKCYPQDIALLVEAESCYNSWAEFRRERDRCKRFTYGDQWGDRASAAGGFRTEEEEIRSQGNLPLKNNLIRRIVRSVLGVYRDRYQEPGVRTEWSSASDDDESKEQEEKSEVLPTGIDRLLQINARANHLEEVYSRTMEEFLIGGLVIHKKWFGTRGHRAGCWTEFIQPDNFFMDRESRDFRGWDLSMIGEVHRLNFNAVLSMFAEDEETERLLGSIYGADPRVDGSEIRCDVIEVWQRKYRTVYRCHDRLCGSCYNIEERDYEELVSRVNRERMEMFGDNARLIESRRMRREEWIYSYLSPNGDVIRRGVSPYKHGCHPYVFKAYPFIDGEIHSFVGDIIDQQKYTNRLISMYDWILRSSAKGVLLFPEGSLPDGVTLDDIADEWSRFNGVILFKPRTGVPLPQQVSSKSVDIGITDLLNIQLQMMEDISGVNGALQGKLDTGSVSGTLYTQQTRNSMIALKDLLHSFEDFVESATEMDVSNLRQFMCK